MENGHSETMIRVHIGSCLVLLDDARETDRVVGLDNLVESGLVQCLALGARHAVRTMLCADEERNITAGCTAYEFAQKTRFVQ